MARVELRSFLYAFFRIPCALLLANVDHLSDVIRVVGTDMRDSGIPRLQLLLVCRFHGVFPSGHHFVQLLNRGRPLLAVKTSECFVVIIEFARRFTSEPCQVSLIPIDQVRSQLPDGMISLAVAPIRLLRSKTFDRSAGGNKPFRFVVRGSELLE